MRLSSGLCSGLAVSLLVICGSLNACAQTYQWSFSSGGNGHYYQLISVPAGTTWDASRSQAAGMTHLGTIGHLATIGSPAENDFLVRSFGTSIIQKWLGGYQPPGSSEPAGGWTWITGELWDYSNWAPHEPNQDQGDNENALHFKWIDTGASLGQWNDLRSSRIAYGSHVMDGFIVEFDYSLDLAVVSLSRSETGGVDFQYEVRGGSLPNATTARLFWANGSTILDSTPIVSPYAISSGFSGAGPVVHVPASAFASPKDGATHVLLVLDSENAVPDGQPANNSKPLALGRIDLIALNLQLSLEYANAVFSYEIKGENAPSDTKIGVYWATSPNTADIIGTVFEEKLSSTAIDGWTISKPYLRADFGHPLVPPPNATWALLVIDPPKPGAPNGAVLEASERNNVYPVPVAPEEPSITIMVDRLGFTGNATGGTSFYEGDTIWKKEFYKLWALVQNNWREEITVNADWTESVKPGSPIENQHRHGRIDDTVVAGNTVSLIALNDSSSGDLFQHTWDWIPSAPAFANSKAEHEVAVGSLRAAFFFLLDHMVKELSSNEVPWFAIGDMAYKWARDFYELYHTTKDEIPEVNLSLNLGMLWWPSSQGANSRLPIQADRALTFSVRSEQRNAYRAAWTYRLLAELFTDLAVIQKLTPLMSKASEYQSVQMHKLAAEKYVLAVDPPDTNFVYIAIPLTNYPPELVAMPEGPSKRLAMTVNDISSVVAAEVTALNRAQGAEAAGAVDWQVRQLAAAAGYASASAMLHATALLLTKQLEPEIQQTLATNKNLLVPTLQQNGLPAELVTDLMGLGWTAAQIEAYRNYLIELGTGLLEEPDLSEMSYALGACLSLADAAQHLSQAIFISRERLGVLPVAVATSQRQQLAGRQSQIEALFTATIPDSNVVFRVCDYLSELQGVIEQTANPEDLLQEIAFGDAALGTILAQASGAENHVGLEILAAKSEVVLNWSARSSFALETSSSLGQTSWMLVSTAPTNQVGHMQVRLTPSNSTAFFRLRKVDPAPSIFASLNGTNAGGTFFVKDMKITGMIADGAGISNLMGGFVISGDVAFTDLSGKLSSYFRKFSLGRSELEQINGGPLQDGTYTFRLAVRDSGGNIVTLQDQTFFLDTHEPSVSLSCSAADVDTNQAGLQVFEGALIPIHVSAHDEAGISSVELFQDGQTVATGRAIPWDTFTVNAPAYQVASNGITFQVRVTDFAGNSSTSAPFKIDILQDTTPPTIKTITPATGLILLNLVDQIQVEFSEPIDPETVSYTNFALFKAAAGGAVDGPDAAAVPIKKITISAETGNVIIGFDALAKGVYGLRIAPGRIVDLAGNLMGGMPFWASQFQKVDSLAPVRIVAGSTCAAAIRKDGSLWAWGQMTDVERWATPRRIGNNTNWRTVALASLEYYGTTYAAYSFTALRTDGTLWRWPCWYYTGTNVVQLGTNTDWAYLAGGPFHGLALKVDGSLWGWGWNSSGQLAGGTNAFYQDPIPIAPTKRWRTVVAGGQHSLGIGDDGTLWGWGENDCGQLGNGTYATQPFPIQIGKDNDWLLVEAADLYTLALKTNGTLWAWGYSYGVVPRQFGTASNWVAVSAGGNDGHCLGIRADGSLWGWGDNESGQLGLGSVLPRSIWPNPVKIGHDNSWVAVSGAQSYSLALKADGTLWSWGANDYGSLGNSRPLQPQRIGADSDWATLAPGTYCSLAVKTNGTLWGWGTASAGDFGVGSPAGTYFAVPTRLGSNDNWFMAANASSSTLALQNDGTLWASGANYNGVLGVGDASPRLSLVPTSAPLSWRFFSLSGYHTLGITSENKLWSWGDNYYGELGLGTNAVSGQNILYPTQVQSSNAWTYVCAASHCSFAITSGGQLMSWGDGGASLGRGEGGTFYNVPGVVGTDHRWFTVAAFSSGQYAAGLKTDGSLWGWGYPFWRANWHSATPLRIGTNANWTMLAAGGGHVAAIQADGSLWAWGDNSRGQCGDGTLTSHEQPVRIGTANDWRKVAAGSVHTLAIKDDGSLWAWGGFKSGQLGDPSYFSPSQVGDGNDWGPPP